MNDTKKKEHMCSEVAQKRSPVKLHIQAHPRNDGVSCHGVVSRALVPCSSMYYKTICHTVNRSCKYNITYCNKQQRRVLGGPNLILRRTVLLLPQHAYLKRMWLKHA